MACLCALAALLWLLWPPLSVPVFLLIVGICNSDDLLGQRPRKHLR